MLFRLCFFVRIKQSLTVFTHQSVCIVVRRLWNLRQCYKTQTNVRLVDSIFIVSLVCTNYNQLVHKHCDVFRSSGADLECNVEGLLNFASHELRKIFLSIVNYLRIRGESRYWVLPNLISLHILRRLKLQSTIKAFKGVKDLSRIISQCDSTTNDDNSEIHFEEHN